MNAFTFYRLTEFIFGVGCVSEIGAIEKRFTNALSSPIRKGWLTRLSGA